MAKAQKTTTDLEPKRSKKPKQTSVSTTQIEDDNNETQSSTKLVGAVVGAIKILRFLGDVQEPCGVSRISKETKLNTSTTFNILRTLAIYDFVQFDSGAKTYTLSLGIMDIAKAATAIGGDIAVVRPWMEKIANDHGVTMTLWQPTGRNRKVLIMTAHTRNMMRIQMAVGQRLPLLVGSTGRLFAAFGTATAKELKTQFEAVRWDKPLTFSDFMAQVDEAKTKGWALDDGNFAAGTVLLSTPIFDSAGHTALAVTANMFAGQYSPERAEAIVKDLKEFSERVSRMGPF